MVWQDNFWREMNRMQKQINRLFNDSLFSDMNYTDEISDEFSTKYRRAFADFNENDKEFIIKVEMPGIEKENIKLNVTDKSIEIKAEKKSEKEKGDKNSENYSYTKSYAGFYRSFDVPDNADLEHVDASYKNGVLTIKLPKKFVPNHKKTIQIK